MSYINIKAEELNKNTFNMIGNEWMLVCAEAGGKANAMTASWGGLGVLWRKNVAFVFVRPQRYTYEFLEKTDKMTLSFFGEEYREALRICGTKSGRECNKIAEAGLTPFSVNDGCTAFKEANIIMECTKMYAGPLLEENIVDPAVMNEYKNGDFHKMYVVSIDRILVKN
ncbi:MAG: flavin reductase family protein [Clostridia bacterium]|nr:flavin reductase family protein [Clostridia bacterium]MBR6650484.1 flavin reductase family protein [Clostridia bacterium]